MKAFILAAGEGRRMRPLTLTTPKPLLQVQGKALIEHHLSHLREAGFHEVIINTAYLGEQIETLIGDGRKWQVDVEYSREGQPLETGGAIRHARGLLGDDPFLLLNADIFTDFPLERLRNLKLRADQLAHLVLVDNPTHHLSGDFVFQEDGSTLMYKTETGSHISPAYTFSGISVINPKQFDSFVPQKTNYPLRDVLMWGCQHSAVSGELFKGYWTDVGTPERLKELNAEQ